MKVSRADVYLSLRSYPKAAGECINEKCLLPCLYIDTCERSDLFGSSMQLFLISLSGCKVYFGQLFNAS